MKLSPSIEAFIRTALPKMEGWCSKDKAISLIARVLAERPTLCVEIGVFGGRSLCAMAVALREIGNGVAYGIDPWDVKASLEGYDPKDENAKWWSNNISHDDIYRSCVDWIGNLQLAEHIRLIRKTNREALSDIISIGKPIEMLHIDGNHTEATSLFDVENYVPLCAPGAIVWFDDTDWASTKAAQERLSALCTFEVLIGTCGMYRKR